MTILLLILFTVTPFVALLSFHENCSEQACHVLMTNLFIMTSLAIMFVLFLGTRITEGMFKFETLYNKMIFLPPRF